MDEDKYQETVSLILSKSDDEELTIEEMIEEFEEKIDFLDVGSTKKTKLKSLVKEIRKESDDKTKEFLFNELVKLANEEE